MSGIAQIAQALHTVLIEQATTAASTYGFVQRQRRISDAQFVQILVGSLLAHPEASFETMVGVAADLGVSISPQGLAERFDERALACLKHVLAATMQHTFRTQPAVLPLLDRFVAVEVQDSTTIALPGTLAEQFTGCGGSHGRVAAALKVQFRWELRTGRLDGPLLQQGRASDRALDFVQRAVPETLRLRDLGYWHLDDLAQDARDGRLWLVRLKPGTALYSLEGQRYDLRELLADQHQQLVDLAVQLGVNHRLNCRLLARRLSEQEADKRVRQLEHTAKRKSRPLSQATRALSEWELLVTNVEVEQLSVSEAFVLRRVRWQIELLFKLWKQHGKLDESRRQQGPRVLIELYAKFMALLIQHWLLLAGCWQQADRSLVKAARVVRAWAERIVRALTDKQRLEALLSELMAALARAGRQTRRKKQAATWQLLGGNLLLNLMRMGVLAPAQETGELRPDRRAHRRC